MREYQKQNSHGQPIGPLQQQNISIDADQIRVFPKVVSERKANAAAKSSMFPKLNL